ncbi:MAG: glycosyltransferase [Nitrososphaerota archaeon]|nr:glycosyltransferase [Nitrososphaerota archaeon]
MSYVSNRTSGVGNRVYYLSRELANLGHDVTILTRSGEIGPEHQSLDSEYGRPAPSLDSSGAHPQCPGLQCASLSLPTEYSA